MGGWMDGWIANGFIYIYIYTIFYNHISYGDVISWLQYNIYVDVIFSSSFTHTMNINTINTWFFVAPSAKEELEDTTQLRLGTQFICCGCPVLRSVLFRWPAIA